MNTIAVSKLLGVSSSTVQRWVKHLGLQMERNEFGHYVYSDEDIELLKAFKQELQNGVPIQNIVTKKGFRKGSVKAQEMRQNDKWAEKIKELESRLNNKADSVVAYQLLQHRSEIEELQAQLSQLNKKIEMLTTKENQAKEHISEEQQIPHPRTRKRKIFGTIFGS